MNEQTGQKILHFTRKANGKKFTQFSRSYVRYNENSGLSRLTLWSLISCNFNLNSASNSEFCAVMLHIMAHLTVPKLLKNTRYEIFLKFRTFLVLLSITFQTPNFAAKCMENRS